MKDDQKKVVQFPEEKQKKVYHSHGCPSFWKCFRCGETNASVLGGNGDAVHCVNCGKEFLARKVKLHTFPPVI